ncbi:MAG TPA: metallopeptidase TldD-related protein [Candidatus Sulfotelmatobacter sp.]|nr:metallopeptidase TldD-related protein [Candidatus Sulfotelmatobacter sp.]
MKNRLGHRVLGCIVGIVLVGGAPARSNPAASEESDVLLSTMQEELHRAQIGLGKLDPAAYYISYSVFDQNISTATATQGSLMNSTRFRRRFADVTMRIGSPALDNAHEQNRNSAITSGVLPLEDDRDAIARQLWRLSYEEYRKASKAFLKVNTGTRVSVQEEDPSPDFSQEKPQTHADYSGPGPLPEQKVLEKMARQYSSYLRKYPFILFSAAVITAHTTRQHFVSSEGSHVVVPSATIRIAIEAGTRARDGMELIRAETFQAENVAHLPPDAEVAARVEKMAADLKALWNAPVADPFDGPALLSGRAAAVFFHEVLGHRLEGRRQRGEQEGQTFTKKVNQQILPDFLSVADDPTLHTLEGMDLGGWYEYDQEGMPAQRVEVIQNGVLKNFLLSRMPIRNFAHSNGHGRGQPGLLPAGRQGNLIVTSSKTVKDSDLRHKLIHEIKRQGKPYGLYFEDIQGGFTLTQRSLPQAFQVLPVLVWRVYPDGRADELVRGVDIVGTPLAALNRILVTGEKTEIFNGICGAESGWIPVSAAAPAMLFSEIEVQKRGHSLTPPPALPRPAEAPPENPAPGSDTFAPPPPDKDTERPQ